MASSRRGFFTTAAFLVAGLFGGTPEPKSYVIVDVHGAGDVKTISEGRALLGGEHHTIHYGPVGGQLIIKRV